MSLDPDKLISDWQKGNFKPVYWFEGEEPYYIDKLVSYAEHHILSESEASFNLTIFYGKDAEWAQVVNACMRYPMFSDKQVVLIKEAQYMKDIDKLENYIQKPLSSTILIVGFKEKKVDGRSAFGKLVKKQEYFHSEKMWDNQLPAWTTKMVKDQGLTINEKALMLLVDSVGNDLNRLANEVDKLKLNLGKRKSITEEDIENYIGISKEFNVFELQNALAEKNAAKALRIIQYFRSNPKANPIQMVLPTLYSFFGKAYTLSGGAAPDGKIFPNSFASRGAQQCRANYGDEGIEKCLLLLHHYNLRSIGINDSGNEGAELLKEMVVKMMN